MRLAERFNLSGITPKCRFHLGFSLVNEGLDSPRRRRPPRHRVRRQLMTQEGTLIQLYGSHHRWLGEDGPQFALLFAVDDATGCVVNALFCEQEESLSYFRLM